MKYLLAVICLFFNWKAENKNLTIQITGIKETKGRIQMGIYNTPTKFPKIGGEYRIEYVNVTAKTITHTIENLPDGYYAIALYHDVNSDKACNRNFLGIPTEPYGFSNNVKPVFSAPSFNSAKFLFDKNTQMNVKLIN